MVGFQGVAKFRKKMNYLLCLVIGFALGLIFSQYLPPDQVSNIVNNMKVKKSTITDSELINDQPERVEKKRGLFKRIFKRKKHV